MLNLHQPQGSVGTSPGLDGAGLSNPDNWRSLLGVPSVLDSRRRSLIGGQPGIVLDGVTANADVRNQYFPASLGQSDISLWVRFRVPSSPGTSNRGLMFLSDNTGYASANGPTLSLFVTSTGALEGRITKDTVNYWTRRVQLSSFVTSYAGQVVDVVFVRNVAGNTAALYVNGNAVGLESSSGTTPPNWNDTLVSGFLVVGRLESTGIFNDRIYRAAVFNRALSAQDVADLIVNGVADADQWGTQTQIVGASVNNGGFETNSLNALGTWNNLGALGSSICSIDTSGLFSNSGSNAGKLTLDSSASFCGFNAANGSNIATVGKRYRLAFFARKGASSGACGVQFGHSLASNAYGVTGTTLTTTHQRTVAEFVAAHGTIALGRQSGSAANAEIYIDDVSLERIGAIVDLNLGEGAGLCFTDRSTNGLHGVGNGGVSHIVPGREGCVRIRTTASGNTQLGGAGIIPANARIRFITADAVSGTPTVTLGNASGSAQHIPSIALAAGFNELSPVARFNTTGNLWVNVSTTATVDWTVRYDLVD